MKKLLVLTLALASSFAALRAQTPDSKTPTFDVASIKQNKTGAENGFFGGPASRWTATNVPLRQFIVFAFQMQAFQFVGMPEWAVTERWDIAAKSERRFPPNPGGIAPNPTVLMLRALLEDRFKLVAHIEKRQAPVYELVLARTDKVLGPELHKSDVDCQELLAASQRGQPLPQPPPGKMLCGITTNTGRISAGAQPIDRLATQLSQLLQRVVVNRTGLMDVYDFELTYLPERIPGAAGADAVPPADPNLPSVFTALQEQLGLKLDSNRAPIDMLVIDHVERPTDD
jgi:uncharacterized protein (TIGR03435 family)